MPSLNAFLVWWGAELASLLPDFIKRIFQADPVQLQLNIATGKASLTKGVQGHVMQVAVLDSQASALPDSLVATMSRMNKSQIETVLFLDPDDVLSLELALPAESEADILEVLGYEMDRQTPFTMDQVYCDYRINRSATDMGQILVHAVVVPRDLMDHWIEHARLWGQSPSIVTIDEKDTGSETRASGFNLLPDELRKKKKPGLTRLNYALGASAIILMAITLVLTLYRQSLLIEKFDQQLAVVSQDVREVRQLREAMDQLVEESGQLVMRKQSSPMTVDVLNELSLVMPDHTWLRRFQLNEMRLTLQGESANASELIGLIEASNMFQDATFASPVVRDQKSDRDRFQITVNLLTPDGR